MWNLVTQILKSGFAGCSHTTTTTILLWLVTWINLYSTGSWTTSTSGLLCFALKCHFDVWLYWQTGQMLLGWDEADLQTNRDLCYVGMDFEVRHALKPMTANHWELNFFIMLLSDRRGQPQLTGLLWKGEGGLAMQVMQSRRGPWRKEPRPLRLYEAKGCYKNDPKRAMGTAGRQRRIGCKGKCQNYKIEWRKNRKWLGKKMEKGRSRTWFYINDIQEVFI